MARPDGFIEVWYTGGDWRWRYREPAHGLVLAGNRSSLTREAAEAAARTAYPGVAIRRPEAGGAGLARRTLAATALGALGVVATLAARRRSGNRHHPS